MKCVAISHSIAFRNRSPRRAVTLVEVLVVVAVAGLLVALLFPAVQSAREAARMAQCKNNLKQVALAVLNYESAHETLPPIRRQASKLSWQYSILPFLEEHGIYDQIQNPNDWDYVNENGIAIAPERPAYVASYQCPTTPGVPLIVRSHVIRTSGDTRGQKIFDALGQSHDRAPFALSSGPCAWYGPSWIYTENRIVEDDRTQPARLRRIADGLSKTILIAEHARLAYKVQGETAGLSFLISFDRLTTSAVINVSTNGLFSYHSAKGAHAAMCDGSVRFISEAIPHEELLRLLLRSDGKTGIAPRFEFLL